MSMRMNDEQRQLVAEAIHVHDENVKFGQKLINRFHHAVTPGDDILIGQIEIILGLDKKE